MSIAALPTPIIYPDSDGQPIADNTLQFRWIVTIQGGFAALYRDDPAVFVAGDLLWYPVEGQPTIRQAPDTLVVYGRPKGERGSYMQWREEQIAPQIVFEVLSPGNTRREMERKLLFYQRYGVEEYYIYDPDHGELDGYLRNGEWLTPIAQMEGWISPRSGVRFALVGNDLVLTRPDGERFKAYLELEEERINANAAREQAETARAQAEIARQQAEARAAALAERLRALGIDPDEH
jgi:Uma2 family endonuclease